MGLIASLGERGAMRGCRSGAWPSVCWIEVAFFFLPNIRIALCCGSTDVARRAGYPTRECGEKPK
jgi:hypothetical protein